MLEWFAHTAALAGGPASTTRAANPVRTSERPRPSLAIALKRQVVVLQAVEHAQNNPGNLFESFTRELKRDQQRLDELESGIAEVLLRLSALELARPNGLRPVFTPGEVDRLMRAAHRINRLDENVTVNSRATDVTIEIARNRDGSVVVFPALPA
ncbi:hypothetical protein SBADM41S_09737 [Streptomyces badius]